MKRIIEAELETNCKSAGTAINRFMAKHPELDYWREELQWMADNGKDYEDDRRMADGSTNNDWAFALHFDFDGDRAYIAVIERA